MLLDLKCSLEVNGLKTLSPVLVLWEGTETFKRQDLVGRNEDIGVGLDSSLFLSWLPSFHGATRPSSTPSCHAVLCKCRAERPRTDPAENMSPNKLFLL